MRRGDPQLELIHGLRAKARRAASPPLPLEEAEQTAFVKWFRWQYPKLKIIAVPNGAYLSGDDGRRAAQMVRLKAAGLQPGTPDLFIPAWLMWVEFKRRHGGVLSEAQHAMIAYLRDECGHHVIVARGADAAIEKVKAWRSSL